LLTVPCIPLKNTGHCKPQLKPQMVEYIQEELDEFKVNISDQDKKKKRPIHIKPNIEIKSCGDNQNITTKRVMLLITRWN
jgi:hypothetical protein